MPKVSVSDSALPPNPDLLKKDPMAEMFGPGSGVKIIGEQDDEIPVEVRAILDEYGLSKKSFQCILKEVPEGSNLSESSASQNSAYVKGWTRSIPSIEFIAKTYGPGSYVLSFTWRSRDIDTDMASKSMHQDVPIEISQKFADEYKKHRLNTKIREASEVGTTVRDTLIEKKVESQMLKALTGEDEEKRVDPATAARDYIQQTIETAKMLGLSPVAASNVPVKSFEWDKILPAVIGGVTAFMQMQQNAAQARSEEFNKMMMLLMSTSQNANNQLLEVMKTQAGVGSGNLAIKEFKDMVLGAIDVKEALNGTKSESLSDKIFRMVESVAPQILSIAASAAQAQVSAKNPVVKMTKEYVENNQDFQALKNNPVELRNFYAKMDTFLGWKQTDMLSGVLGWERPSECPRIPSQELPPEMAQTSDDDEVAAE